MLGGTTTKNKSGGTPKKEKDVRWSPTKKIGWTPLPPKKKKQKKQLGGPPRKHWVEKHWEGKNIGGKKHWDPTDELPWWVDLSRKLVGKEVGGHPGGSSWGGPQKEKIG